MSFEVGFGFIGIGVCLCLWFHGWPKLPQQIGIWNTYTYTEKVKKG